MQNMLLVHLASSKHHTLHHISRQRSDHRCGLYIPTVDFLSISISTTTALLLTTTSHHIYLLNSNISSVSTFSIYIFSFFFDDRHSYFYLGLFRLASLLIEEEMDILIGLVNNIQKICTALGDYGGDDDYRSSLPTIWDSLPTIVVVGGQVIYLPSISLSTRTQVVICELYMQTETFCVLSLFFFSFQLLSFDFVFLMLTSYICIDRQLFMCNCIIV